MGKCDPLWISDGPARGALSLFSRTRARKTVIVDKRAERFALNKGEAAAARLASPSLVESESFPQPA